LRISDFGLQIGLAAAAHDKKDVSNSFTVSSLFVSFFRQISRNK